jgi:hypothetical protein
VSDPSEAPLTPRPRLQTSVAAGAGVALVVDASEGDAAVDPRRGVPGSESWLERLWRGRGLAGFAGGGLAGAVVVVEPVVVVVVVVVGAGVGCAVVVVVEVVVGGGGGGGVVVVVVVVGAAVGGAVAAFAPRAAVDPAIPPFSALDTASVLASSDRRERQAKPVLGLRLMSGTFDGAPERRP